MFLGGDISFVNEVEDGGGIYRDGGMPTDPIQLLAAKGANIARVRLWHTPTWTRYSTLDDVKRTLRRAKTAGMRLMLDFHYSDTWADPAKQTIPAAWEGLSLDELAQAIHDYTLDVLLQLHAEGLTPDDVQVGNEINTEIMRPADTPGDPIDWPRNIRLINAGLAGVKRAREQTGTAMRAMLHIAQPEHLIGWFDAAYAAGLADFDDIGLSYYPKWSVYDLAGLGETIKATHARYGKPVMVVETAYPWTQELGLADDHLLGHDAVAQGYPATPDGQRQFLIDLTQSVYNAGGTGVVYWEPAWISTPVRPTHWENAALFDYDGNALPGLDYLSYEYRKSEASDITP